ncbi:MAG: M1 family metallopeptidase [Bacteroidota bacterium]
MIKRKLIVILAVLFFAACKEKAEKSLELIDPHSFSQPDKAVVKHLDLDINVDFSKEQISGKAVWKIEKNKDAGEIVFDNNGLSVARVTLGADEKETTFKLGKADPILGEALQVAINDDTEIVTIYYSTNKGAAALQWLNKQQTAGKQHPYLFTQSESIAARSWIPCQDSPGIRFTYNARVTVPKELLALMSAENPQVKNAKGVYEFKQAKAIPSYLLALAVGDIAFKAVDGRTGIYAEPSVLNKAVYEFADMGKMVTAAEKLYGPYRWGRYDLLILPPSFPFGGMENPNLNFITPTIIAGDRSLVNIICHELAHSWSGNLVTNKTWNDFWLNEGFTNYFERRIVEVLYGKEEAEMQEEFGRQALDGAVKDMADKPEDTYLKGNYKGRNADDATNDIAYEKGYFFLRTIEAAVGRSKLDSFLRAYFDGHAFKSVSTEDFVDYLNKNLIKGNADLEKKIRVKDWVYGPGIPSNIAFSKNLWKEGGKYDEINSMIRIWLNNPMYNPNIFRENVVTTNEKRYLLSRVPDKITFDQMEYLDLTFNLTASNNTDIQLAWYTMAIKNNYTLADKRIKEYLINNGRMWHIIPIYKELLKSEKGRKKALEVYKLARPNYHPMTYTYLDKMLK